MADEIHTSLCSPMSCWSTNWLPPFLPMEFNQIQTSFIDSSQQQIKYMSDQTFMHGSPFDPDQFNDLNTQLPRVSSHPKQPLNFSNNTPFWNPSATSSAPHKFVEPRFDDESSSSNMIKTKKISGTEPASKKRPRTETQRGLPTFKVRKEKLGDRITALQQLVSPFGKTDTSSVLHEAIEYIKFLHGQVGSLSTPYLKNGHQMHSNGYQMQYQLENSEINAGGMKQDLKGRGLCLVPISSTLAVASETPMDFWAPNNSWKL